MHKIDIISIYKCHLDESRNPVDHGGNISQLIKKDRNPISLAESAVIYRVVNLEHRRENYVQDLRC